MDKQDEKPTFTSIQKHYRGIVRYYSLLKTLD